jgi:hypothetical protein
VLSLVEAYNYVSTSYTAWDCTYEHCAEADKGRLEFYAQQYVRIPQLSSRLRQLVSDEADMTYFDVTTTDNGYIEYILLATKANGDGTRNVDWNLIVDCRQSRSNSMGGWLISLGLTGAVAYVNPYYGMSCLFKLS